MTRLKESSRTDNPQQRFSLTRIALVLGLVMLTVVVGHLLPILNSSDFHREMRNALHVVAFAAVAALFFSAVPGSLLKKTLVTFLLAATLALLAELSQQLVGLSFDYFDIVRDLLKGLLSVKNLDAFIRLERREKLLFQVGRA